MKNNFISKKNIAVGIIALVIGVFAFVGIVKAWGHSTTTVTGNVAAFILNPEGRVDGAVLDDGKQVRFGAETGAIVTQQIKVGDALTVSGHAGYKSNYGQEFHAESLQINGQSITVIHAKPMPPHEKGDKVKPRDGKRPVPPVDDKDAQNVQPNAENNAQPVAPVEQKREISSANGLVRIILVGGRGEARGLILGGGEQIALPKEVNDANLTFNNETQVSVEGETAKSDFGTFINPTRLTIGNQTFSFNR